MTGRREELRERYVEVCGRWDDSLDGLLELDPEFFAAYVGLAAAPFRGRHWSRRCASSCCSRSTPPARTSRAGLRLHIRRALELGATKAELLEVLQLTDARDPRGHGRRADPGRVRRGRRTRPGTPLTARQAELRRASRRSAATGTPSGTGCSTSIPSSSRRTWSSRRTRGSTACWSPSSRSRLLRVRRAATQCTSRG